jgi:peptide/nickel transport system substrate-binding protein
MGGDCVRRTWFRVPAALGVAGMLLLTACGGSTAPTTANNGPTPTASGPVTVTIFQTTPPSGDFNPLMSESNYETDIEGLIFDTLLTLDQNLGYQPWMATYAITDNGKTLTYKLKSGIKFQDGNTLTSKDVKATIDFIMNPDYAGPLSSNFSALKGAAQYQDALSKLQAQATPPKNGGAAQLTQDQYEQQAQKLYQDWLSQNAVETPDDSTVIFHMDSVYAPILQYTGLLGIMEASQLAQLNTPDKVKNAAKESVSTNPIGSGPFQFVKYQTGQFTQLKAFKDYWAGAPKFDQIIFKVANQNEEVGLLQKGDVDAVGVGASQIDPQDTDLLKKIPGVQSWEFPQFGIQVMDLNLRQKRFQDYRVRQAMMYAIDRQGIVDQLLAGHGTVMNTFFAPPSWAYPHGNAPDGVDGMYPHDPQKAKDLLQQAGWTVQNGVLTNSSGDTMKFTLLYPGGSSNPVRQRSAPIIQQDLNQVGFQVQTQAMDFNQLVNLTNNTSKTTDKSFDATLIGWGFSIDPDPTGLFATSDVYNLAYWNPSAAPAGVYDKSMQLIQQGVATFDQSQRQQIYRQLGVLFATYLPNLFLYSQNQETFFDARVKGVTQDARGALFQVQNWTVSAK